MTTQTAQGLTGTLGTVLPLVLIVGLMIVMMVLPQRRQEKKMKQMMETLKPGKRIRTIGGIYGRIEQVKDDVVVIVLEPDTVKMTISKGAISTVEDSDVENDAEIAVKESKK